MAETDAGGTILILEDDPGIAHLERTRLERAGYAVELAVTADEARRYIERGGIDLMVLDYRLKGGSNGLDLHNALRAEGLGVPSVLVTAFNDEALLAQALRAGVRDFIPKTPDYLDFLVPTVSRVMTQVRTERQLEAEHARRVYEQFARAEAEAQRAALAESEARLRALTGELATADRRKDEFIAILAHELRSPLAAITNAVALSRRGGGEDDRGWALDVIARQVGNLTRLIDDLLDVSRIRTGKLQLRTEQLDAAGVVADAVEAVRPFVEAKRHTLDVEVAPGPHWVEADPTRLEQVIVNLLTNAAKYTDEGGRIGLWAGREAGEFVVRVRDSGVGIAPEMIPKLFNMFAQIEGSLDRAHGGLGIGLTLVRTLIDMHGGSVAVASEGPGRGSEFTIRIPALADAPPQESRDEPAAGNGARAGARTGPRRVLVVDDDADTSRGMVRLLRGSGHDARSAGDGRSAIEAARDFRPDVVLLDIRLPDTDGYSLASRLRAEAGLDRAVIVAVSGFGREQDLEQSRLAGFDHHLIKPVDIDSVLALVAGAAPAAAGTDPR
jgi:signal transduction histidine kinase